MYNLSEAAANALRTGAIINPVMEIYNGFGSIVASTEGTPPIYLEKDGGITIFRKAAHTRKFQCTVVDEEGVFTPGVNSRILDPVMRQQVAFYFDVKWISPETGFLTAERIPAGRFVLEDCVVTEVNSGGVTMELSGRSRTILIEENPWRGPFSLSDMSYPDAIKTIIEDRKPADWSPVYNFTAEHDETIPDLAFTGDDRSDPWAEVQKLLEGCGCEMVDDPSGALVLREIPDPQALPIVWYYDDSELSTGIPGYKREIHTSELYNGVIVNGTAPWLLFPVQGVAWDTDPMSPTYYLGPLGMKPKIIDNAIVTNTDTANHAAEAELKNVLGVTEEVTFEAIPNPAQDIGDVVILGSSILKMNPRRIMFEEIQISFDVTQPMRGTVQTKRSRSAL